MRVGLSKRTMVLVLFVLMSVASCASLMGEDGVYVNNPCSLLDLDPLNCGVGACQSIIPSCVNGLPQLSCPTIITAQFESCGNGLDDNCDGLIDEGCPCLETQVQNCYSGTSLTRNVGVCITGIQACAQGFWGDCTGEVLPELENCGDILDNDCNGAVNDDCPCTEGEQRECYGGPLQTMGGSGCKGGVQTCIDGVWGDCELDIIPGDEVCDGFDNDCNGETDELASCGCFGDQTVECYTGDKKLIGVGVCKSGFFACKSGSFDRTNCQQEVLAGAEVCNGLDDDCNGLNDDAQGLGLDCHTELPGICQFGKTDCGIDVATGLPGVICRPVVFPNLEQTCNLVDDNCDGEVDEGTMCCPDDGIQNGSETDVNCGGTCPERCPDGKKCDTGPDCESGVCTSGICDPTPFRFSQER